MLNSSNSSTENTACPYFLSIMYSWTATTLVMLPLFCWVFYVGYKQRKNSHTNVFTYHIITMEILLNLGTAVYTLGGKINYPLLVISGKIIYSIGTIGQIFIHILTCLERYLAVIHPIAYMRLKNRGGVMIRNGSIVVVWLLSIVIRCLGFATPPLYVMISMLIITFCALSLVAFFSVSVLYVLLRPGPGDGGGDSWRVDKSKRRAFTTMIAIAFVLILKFTLLIVNYTTYLLGAINSRDICTLAVSAHFFMFPGTLVLPLLFLQRAGKLPKPSRFFGWCRCIKWHNG